MLYAWERIEIIPGFGWKTRSKETVQKTVLIAGKYFQN
jgi:hypothetical protein